MDFCLGLHIPTCLISIIRCVAHLPTNFIFTSILRRFLIVLVADIPCTNSLCYMLKRPMNCYHPFLYAFCHAVIYIYISFTATFWIVWSHIYVCALTAMFLIVWSRIYIYMSMYMSLTHCHVLECLVHIYICSVLPWLWINIDIYIYTQWAVMPLILIL